MNDDTIDEGKLRDLMSQVAALPRSIEPPPDAWKNIRSAIEAEKSGARFQTSSRSPFWQRPIFLAAAALILVAGSSAVTAIALRRLSRAPGSATAVTPNKTGAQYAVNGSGPASLAQFTVVESDYLRAVNDLSATLESERGSLSPETVAKLRESIKIIDAAILEARNALAADPSNTTLIKILANSYEQKVDLLKRTTEMARG